MTEQDFLQNTGTLETPTNKSQAIAKLLGSDKPDEFDKLASEIEAKQKKRKEEDVYRQEQQNNISKFQEKNPARPKVSRKEAIDELYRNVQSKLDYIKSKKATGAITYKTGRKPTEALKPNPSRFYSPDTTFGVDDGVRRIGRFPMGAGLKYNLPPLISTNAQGQARAGLKIKKPPMFGGV